MKCINWMFLIAHLALTQSSDWHVCNQTQACCIGTDPRRGLPIGKHDSHKLLSFQYTSARMQEAMGWCLLWIADNQGGESGIATVRFVSRCLCQLIWPATISCLCNGLTTKNTKKNPDNLFGKRTASTAVSFKDTTPCSTKHFSDWISLLRSWKQNMRKQFD